MRFCATIHRNWTVEIPETEFKARWEKAWKELKARGIDYILVENTLGKFGARSRS